MRVGFYLCFVVGAAWALRSANVHAASVRSTALTEIQAAQLTQESSAIAFLVTSNHDAVSLAEAGMIFLKNNQFSLASAMLQAASQKDPMFRDAAVYAGFAELAQADSLWANDPASARAETELARTYLEQARTIDPIHSYTHELLAIAYSNLGETELAAEAKGKSELFVTE